MFKWLGIETSEEKTEKEPDPSKNVTESKDDEKRQGLKADAISDSTTASPESGPKSNAADNLSGTTGISGALGLLSNLANVATKTAHRLKESVDVKIDQTIIGDFQRENEKFIKEKHSKRIEDPVPPWVGYNEEKEMKTQILALSSDERNFMRDPPSGVDFHFDLEVVMPVALKILEQDQELQNMRFSLVPKKIKEEKFWHNYFYRVSLIKQSSQLSTLAQSETKRNTNSQESKRNSMTDSEKSEATTEGHLGSNNGRDGKEKVTTNETLMSKGSGETTKDAKGPETADWEKELQDELQDFEFVSEDQGDSQEPNPEWEKEIEDMLGLDDDETDQTTT
ncbi:synapse-associated protein 1-like [Rhopilema esculentum]|uniref:synapse-associated protein 1-like n=1 Tax=Rhopilema esculentum TaxID=499914 RepID=UPI0031D2308B